MMLVSKRQRRNQMGTLMNDSPWKNFITLEKRLMGCPEKTVRPSCPYMYARNTEMNRNQKMKGMRSLLVLR